MGEHCLALGEPVRPPEIAWHKNLTYCHLSAQTARAGLDKIIGSGRYLMATQPRILGGIRCADLTAPQRSDPSLFK